MELPNLKKALGSWKISGMKLLPSTTMLTTMQRGVRLLADAALPGKSQDEHYACCMLQDKGKNVRSLVR